MRTVLNSVLLMLGLCFISGSSAYEMGSMNILSSVNEPLEARISLTGEGDQEKDPVIVDMASKIDFLRHKVRRGYYVSDLQASFEKDLLGEPVIRIQSSQPVMARGIELLVMMLTTKERKLGKYRFILPQVRAVNDPPVVAVNRMPDQNRSRIALAQLKEKKESKTITAENKTIHVGITHDTYKVLPGDSLSYIAMKLLPNYPQYKSWKELMDHLAKMNSDVFPHQNINSLRVASILKLPVQKEKKMLVALSTQGNKDSVAAIDRKVIDKVSVYEANQKVARESQGKSFQKQLRVESIGNSLASGSMDRWKKHKSAFVISPSFVEQSLSYKTLDMMDLTDTNADIYQPQGVFSGAVL